MNKDIEKILLAGSKAPSGSNSQPWKFRVKDNLIEIIATPEKDHPILNFRNRGTWVAHGALIENILIACNHFGYEADLKIFPDKSQPNLTAKIFLKKTSPGKEPLYNSIFKRTTNRRLYKKISLTDEEKNYLLNSVNEIGKGNIRLIEEQKQLTSLAQPSSVSEIVNLENKELHKLFFEEIVWNEKEELREKEGLYLKTMELPPPARLMLRLFRFWPIMKLFNLLGAAKMISKSNYNWYSHVSALGAIIIEDKDEEFITAGRLMERIWLKTTYLGLNLHLITGTLFFGQKIMSGDVDIFSSKHQQLIEKSYKKTSEIFNVDKNIIALMFRVGHSRPPSAFSSKKLPVIIK